MKRIVYIVLLSMVVSSVFVSCKKEWLEEVSTVTVNESQYYVYDKFRTFAPERFGQSIELEHWWPYTYISCRVCISKKNSSEVAYLLYMWGYQSKVGKIEDGQEYSVAYSPFVDSLRFSLKTLPPAPHKYWHDAIGYKIQDTKNGMAFICDLDNNSFVPLTGQFRFVSISRNLIEFYLEGENENGEKYIVISKQK